MKPRQPAAEQSAVPGANSSPDAGKPFLAGSPGKDEKSLVNWNLFSQ
jgi:hypothetical protein